MIGQIEFIITLQCTQPISEVILCAAKSEKFFQDAIMLVILPKIDLHLLKATLIFLSKISLLSCVDYFKQKEFKNLFPRQWCFYKHSSHLLKNVNVQTMHLGRFYSFNIRLTINSFLNGKKKT